jgi:hypothetical protein
MHELAYFLDMAPLKYICDAPIDYPDRVYSVEYELLLIQAQIKLQPNEDSSILSPMANGLFLYIYTNLRLTPVGSQIRRTLVENLKASLLEIDLLTLNESFPAELVWLLFMGGTAASEQDQERPWYIQQLRRILDINGWCEWNWTSIAGLLKGVLWIERVFMDNCERFFQEFWIMR